MTLSSPLLQPRPRGSLSFPEMTLRTRAASTATSSATTSAITPSSCPSSASSRCLSVFESRLCSAGIPHTASPSLAALLSSPDIAASLLHRLIGVAVVQRGGAAAAAEPLQSALQDDLTALAWLTEADLSYISPQRLMAGDEQHFVSAVQLVDAVIAAAGRDEQDGRGSGQDSEEESGEESGQRAGGTAEVDAAPAAGAASFHRRRVSASSSSSSIVAAIADLERFLTEAQRAVPSTEQRRSPQAAASPARRQAVGCAAVSDTTAEEEEQAQAALREVLQQLEAAPELLDDGGQGRRQRGDEQEQEEDVVASQLANGRRGHRQASSPPLLSSASSSTSSAFYAPLFSAAHRRSSGVRISRLLRQVKAEEREALRVRLSIARRGKEDERKRRQQREEVEQSAIARCLQAAMSRGRRDEREMERAVAEQAARLRALVDSKREALQLYYRQQMRIVSDAIAEQGGDSSRQQQVSLRSPQPPCTASLSVTQQH